MHTCSMAAAALAALLLVPSFTSLTSVSAQTPAPADKRTYNWYGEMVSFDGKMATTRVPVEAPVATYFDRFKPGEKVVLVFTANPGKPDVGPVLYMATLDVMKASKVDVGYIIPAEFVSGDAAGKTVTVKVAMPDSAAAAVKAVAPGGWVKVTAPMSQPGDTAAVSMVAASAKPAPFVRDAPPAPPAKPEEKKGA
jgi:hypothetical protein